MNDSSPDLELARAPSARIVWSWMQPYVAKIREDAAFHCFIAAYGVAGMLVAATAGVPHKFLPLSHLGLAFTVPIVTLLAIAGMALLSLRSREPLRELRVMLRKALSPHVIAGLVMFMSLAVFMSVFTSLKSMLTDVVPFFADPYLADLDEALHGRDPWLYTRVLMAPQLLPALEAVYFIGWAVAIIGSLLAVLLASRLQAVRTQFVWTCLIAWPLLGNVFAAAVMSGGPALFDLTTGGQERFEDMRSYLAANATYFQTSRSVLWRAYLGEMPGSGIAISAFPSLHVAKATLLVLLASRINQWAFAASLTFCATILFGSVQLGWHYAIDGYFSIVATVAIWKLVGIALERKNPLQPEGQRE